MLKGAFWGQNVSYIPRFIKHLQENKSYTYFELKNNIKQSFQQSIVGNIVYT